jgi:hypothetical protein
MVYAPHERGQSIGCCSLVAALIVVPLLGIIILLLLGPAIDNVFNNIVTTI